MNIIMCQPENLRFRWELEISITNLLKVGYNNIILLMLNEDSFTSNYLKEKFPNVKIFGFDDNRDDKGYIPSIKPYLWYKFLEKYPIYENEDFLYIDSDVIFREKLELDCILEDNNWYGSNCSSYLNYDYISQCELGVEIFENMCKIVGIDQSEALKLDQDYIGAQLIVKKPTKTFWKKVYNDSNAIWNYLLTVDSNIQKWTAEMWSQCYNMIYFKIVALSNEEFNFSWATDPIEEWYKNKIFHNAGVVDDSSTLLFKGKYVEHTPFNENLDEKSHGYAQFHYIQAIKEVINKQQLN